MAIRNILNNQGEIIGQAIVCSRGRLSTPECEFCHRAPGTQQCDYPTSFGKTCSRYVCRSCAARRPNIDVDYCPDHRERAGLGPPPEQALDYTSARWIDARYADRCRVDRCYARIDPGNKCLFLPRERGVLCERCGAGSGAGSDAYRG